MSSVFAEFEKTCVHAGHRPFLHVPAVAARGYSNTAIDLSYAETLQKVRSCASLYRERGYGAGQRVAIALQNRAEFFIHWLALNSLGCSVLPLGSDLSAGEIAYFLDHGDALLVVALPEALDTLGNACAQLENPPPMVSSAGFDSLPAATGSPAELAIDGQTECALLYTSGSTGKPKGCILSNEYFLRCGAWYIGLDGLAQIREGDRLLTPLPLNHMNAMAVSSMAMIMSGGCIVQLDRFHPSSWWESVRESGATIVHYLGVLPAILLELPETPGEHVGEQVRFGFGAGVNPAHHARFEERFGFPLVEAWAMTESGCAGSIIANREPRHVGTCCFGIPGDQLEFQLVDEQKQPVPPGEPGELRVRARGDEPRRGFFSGYLKNPGATEEAWQDGWLNTGDVVREGPDGSLHFVDRRKNVIRRSGENISALEVESALSGHTALAEAVVCAVPDDLRGDEVAACVVLAETEHASEELATRITLHCQQQLAYYKVPAYILFCDEIPHTASNKPRRGEVKALARRRVEAGDCHDLRRLKQRRKAS